MDHIRILRGIFFTRATSQNPCSHEALATRRLYFYEFLTTSVIAGNFQKKTSKGIVSNFPCWLF